MFWIKQAYKVAEQPGSNKVWSTLENVWSRCKGIFSDYLSKKTAHLSPSRLRVFLYTFLLVCTCISIYIILSPFINPIHSTISQKQNILTPTKVYERDKAIRYADSAISYKNYRRIEKFEQYLDSLCTTDAGKKQYANLIKLHPGLIDSLIKLKEIYHSQ